MYNTPDSNQSSKGIFHFIFFGKGQNKGGKRAILRLGSILYPTDITFINMDVNNDNSNFYHK